MSILDINENSLNHTDVIRCAIKKFLNEFHSNHTNKKITIDDKCYLLANKTRKEIEYDSNLEQYWLMFDLDFNVFIAKLRPNWAMGNRGIYIMSGYHGDKFLGHVSLDYILTNYEI